MNAPTTTEQHVIDAVSDGVDTTEGLVDRLDLSKGHLQKVLKGMVEAGHLDRVRDGPGYTYVLPGESGASAASDDAGVMPVHRNYDWSDPDYHANPSDYYATDGELVRLMAQVKHRRKAGSPVRALITGDTGTGKTTLAETVAAWNESREDAIWISVQFSKGTDDGHLLGVPSFAGGDTVWVDGTLTKAFLAAREGKTVHLHLDEFNRAPAHVHNALFEALDHRAAIRLDGPRGGELISVDPNDIIVTATINEGDEYHGTERMDLAAKGRFTSKFETDYLARHDPGHDEADAEGYVGIDAEANLLVERRGLPAELSKLMVRAAADVRRDASDPANTTVEWGVPTRAVLSWAGLALMYGEEGIPNPVIQAAEDGVIETYYGDRGYEDMANAVRNIIESHLDGAPLDERDFETWAADEQVVCAACGWAEAKPAAEEMGVLATMECPDCGSMDSVTTRSK